MVESGSNKRGPRLDEERKQEIASLEKSGKEAHVEDERRQQDDESGETGSGHRVAGAGSSADEYSYTDHGEEGGSSHPKPKE